MIKKYNEANEKYKGLYITKAVLTKSYLTGILFALVISSIFFLPLVNLLFLRYHLTLISLLLLFTALLFVYLLFFFKDKALVEYIPEAKEVNLRIIRLGDIIVIGTLCLVIYTVFLLFFRWW